MVKTERRASEVIEQDLDYICSNLMEEFSALGGHRVLITGGAGFLGHYLVQAAIHWNSRRQGKPIRLVVFDNYVRGIPEWLKNLESNPHVKFVQHDMTRPLPADLGEFPYIVHAASIASPTYYRKYPIETMDSNVNGLRNLLEYFSGQQKTSGSSKGLLFFSSSEIYGDPTPENIPTPETYRGNVSCTGPRACYDEAKRYGETLCVNFARQYGLPVKVARPFNNYGPGLKITDRRVIPDFARDILAGKDLVLLSDGSPMRTFCYVADAVVGYYKILVRGGIGEAYNIGVESPEISMASLADQMVALAGELYGYKGKVVRQSTKDQDYLSDNPARRCPVISKARKDLGYAPSIPLEEGLRRSLIWYGENRDAQEA
jgi:nucleoside-diphosphate-sugar epimerase